MSSLIQNIMVIVIYIKWYSLCLLLISNVCNLFLLDVLDVNKFITQLPMKSASYSAHSHIKKLYESCLNLEMLEKSAAEVSLKKLISSIGEWNYFSNCCYWLFLTPNCMQLVYRFQLASVCI